MILCSGNPNNLTVAQAIKQIYPDTAFLCRSHGYDLTNHAGLEMFEKIIVDHNVFINSSSIAPGVQLQLLDLACRAWMKSDIRGHVISIGTTAEHNPGPTNSEYIQSKISLRARSLELNEQTGITGVKTTYIILGGLNTGKNGEEEYPTVFSVANAIDWLIKCQNRVPLIQIESPK